MPAHRPTRLSCETYFVHPIDWRLDMELSLKEQAGKGTFDLSTLDGQRIGELDGPYHVNVEQALKEGRTLKVVVVGVSEQLWSGALPSPSPIIEIWAREN